MSEADYMDDCDMVSLWDAQHKDVPTHEVKVANRIVFVGSRAACWAYKNRNGGFVQEANQ